MLDEALTKREKMHDNNRIASEHIKVKQHLSEADIDVYDYTEDEKLLKNHVQQMRQNHYLKKSALKQQKKFVKRMSSGLKINKLMAFETEYDFYFQNN